MQSPKLGKQHHSRCVTRTLARGDVARIDVCDECGVLVLHLGPVSLRVQRAALRSLSATVTAALRGLEGAHETSDADSTGVRHKWVARGRA